MQVAPTDSEQPTGGTREGNFEASTTTNQLPFPLIKGPLRVPVADSHGVAGGGQPASCYCGYGTHGHQQNGTTW